MSSHKYDYDAIIIGAGISGLVCGCYLAKAGLRTLIVEKNGEPGGYCASFTRNGFRFDACAHSLGSLRPNGIIANILKELNIDKRINFVRYDPQDVIITLDDKIFFWNDLDKTICELQQKFPKEASNIKRFFQFIDNCEGVSFNSLKHITFQALLNDYFKDSKLKSILTLPILGNMGLPASQALALTAVTIFKEFILDGGYYPKGGMQKLPDILLDRFKEYGGKMLSPSFVTKIKVKNNRVEGIEVNGCDFISAEFIISNADITQTYRDLIGQDLIGQDVIKKLNTLKPSLSIFMLYLGTDGKIDNTYNSSSTWYLPSYDIDKIYHYAEIEKIEKIDWFLAHFLSDNKSLLMLINVPFKKSEYWVENKAKLMDVFIKKLEWIFPDLSNHIIFKDAATPYTLYKWTLNYKGAAYGWAGMPSQFALNGFRQTMSIKNLYLAGHWTTLVQGISGVAYTGRDTANIILKRKN